jgi:hypothetical protein
LTVFLVLLRASNRMQQSMSHIDGEAQLSWYTAPNSCTPV